MVDQDQNKGLVALNTVSLWDGVSEEFSSFSTQPNNWSNQPSSAIHTT